MTKMILSSERMIGEQNNPIVNEHLKVEIRTLQNASRSRQVREAFASKDMTKRRSGAD